MLNLLLLKKIKSLSSHVEKYEELDWWTFTRQKKNNEFQKWTQKNFSWQLVLKKKATQEDFSCFVIILKIAIKC